VRLPFKGRKQGQRRFCFFGFRAGNYSRNIPGKRVAGRRKKTFG